MKLFAGDDYKFNREAVAIDDALERMTIKAQELLQLADALESAGKPVDVYLRSQLELVLFMDCLGRGKWESARAHCLTLAELLPDFPPILAVALR